MTIDKDTCCYEWEFDGVCFTDKRGFSNFTRDNHLQHFMRINRNKGTQLPTEDNIYVWTTKNADLFVITSDNPSSKDSGSRKERCGGGGSEFIRKMNLLGSPDRVKKVADYLRKQASMNPAKLLREKQGMPRKNVVKIGHESACMRT